MNAIELANQLDHESDLGEFNHYEAAAMLRKQDAAIKQLRETLGLCQQAGLKKYVLNTGESLATAIESALAATEEFK